MSNQEEGRHIPRVAGQYAATAGRVWFRIGPWRDGDPEKLTAPGTGWRCTVWNGTWCTEAWNFVGPDAVVALALVVVKRVMGLDAALLCCKEYAAEVLMPHYGVSAVLYAEDVMDWVAAQALKPSGHGGP